MSFLHIEVPFRLTLVFAVVVMFSLVFVPVSDAALPYIGSCTFMEFFCGGRKCNTQFYQRLQKDPKGDCRLVKWVGTSLYGLCRYVRPQKYWFCQSWFCPFNALSAPGFRAGHFFLKAYLVYCHLQWSKRKRDYSCSDPVFACLHSSAKYNQFVDCSSKAVQICFNHELPESQVREIVHQAFKESMLCVDGIVEMPTLAPGSPGLPCSASFSNDANACVKTFHERFTANKSDPSLCP